MNDYKKYFLDTNIFLRVIAKDDPVKLSECESLINKISKKQVKAVTSGLVIAEVVWTCLKGYKLTRDEVRRVVAGILGTENLQFYEKSDVHLAAGLFARHNVKFIDCMIASHPDIASGKMAIISYDRDFDKMAVPRFEPSDLK